MDCGRCGTVNDYGASFCRQCGQTLGPPSPAFATPASIATCKNDHEYDAHLAECPYCPKPAPSGALPRAKRRPVRLRTVVDDSGEPTQPLDGSLDLVDAAGLPGARAKRKAPKGDPGAPALRGWLVVLKSTALELFRDLRVRDGWNGFGRVGPGGDPRVQDVADPLVSARHASLTVHEGVYVLEDAGSEHGTWVNDGRVQRAQIQAGDLVRLGGTTFVFVPFLCQPLA